MDSSKKCASPPSVLAMVCRGTYDFSARAALLASVATGSASLCGYKRSDQGLGRCFRLVAQGRYRRRGEVAAPTGMRAQSINVPLLLETTTTRRTKGGARPCACL
jgi:hypothetical protein